MRFIFFILLGAASYGLLSTFVKLAYRSGFSVQEVSGGQNVFGSIMMIVLWLLLVGFKGRAAAGKFTIKSIIGLLPVGLASGSTGILYYSSLQYIPASIAIILLFQFTWIGVLIEAILDRKLPSKEKILALVLVFLGTFMESGIFENGWSQFTLLGTVLGLLSAVSYSLYIVLSGRVAVHLHPLSRSLIFVLVSLVLVMFVFPPTFMINGALSDGLWVWALLLSFFGVVIPPICFAIGVPKTGGGLASILSSIELPVVVLMSGLVLGEKVTALQWIGVIAIIVGIALPEAIVRRRSHKAAMVTPNNSKP